VSAGPNPAFLHYSQTQEDNMEFPKPKFQQSIEDYGRMLGKQSMPEGGNQHYAAKSKIWASSKLWMGGNKDAGASFSFKSRCEGSLEAIWAIAKPMYEEAVRKGNLELARDILERMKQVPLERQLSEHKQVLAKMVAKLAG
jgi:hypothetical protein